MEPGLNQTLEYIWLDNLPRFTEARPTDVIHMHVPFLERTINPNWLVRERESNNMAEFEWLNYLTLDKSPWSVRILCSFYHGNEEFHVPEYITTMFQHQPYGGGEPHFESYMFFLDFDYNPWKAQLVPLDRPFPVQPKFILSRV
jgi:hypothetical protein